MRTTLEGVGKTDADLLAAVNAAAAGTPLRWVAVESADELVRLAELHRLRRDRAGQDFDLPVLLRLNPDVQPETTPGLAVGLAASKFGLSPEDLVDLASSRVWRGGLRLRGVHVHMGSHLRDVSAWAVAGCRAVRMLSRVVEVYPGPGTPDVVDFGGGFPAHGTDPTPADFAAALTDELARAGLSLPPTPAIEPGRVVVGAAGWLVAAVLHTRLRGDDRQVVLDVGMTELIRPALYGSRHHVTSLEVDEVEVGDVTVEGAVCESTDTFGVHPLPRLDRGDLVVLHEAGAYGASFSSRYNGRPPAPEVLLWPDGTLQLGERIPTALSWATARTHPDRRRCTARPRKESQMTTSTPGVRTPTGGRSPRGRLPGGRRAPGRSGCRHQRAGGGLGQHHADGAGRHADDDVQPVPELLRR